MRTSAASPPNSLSPSRASDFMQCPLLYRFRVIDKLPEKPSPAATRGTVVHAVLERLFDAPAGERSVARARSMVAGEWERLLARRPELAQLFAEDSADGAELARWLAEAESLVERWFTLEDPTRLEPAERELFVETRLESGLRLRGIIDRIDVAPTGEIRIVDYKTGKAPPARFADGALFQMTFYALVVRRLRGVLPRRLQLVFLGSGDVLTYDPGEEDLRRVERKVLALWDAIQRATESGDWRPKPSRLCDWCDHQAHCPEFGGTPPPYPLTLQPRLPEPRPEPEPDAQPLPRPRQDAAAPAPGTTAPGTTAAGTTAPAALPDPELPEHAVRDVPATAPLAAVEAQTEAEEEAAAAEGVAPAPDVTDGSAGGAGTA